MIVTNLCKYYNHFINNNKIVNCLSECNRKQSDCLDDCPCHKNCPDGCFGCKRLAWKINTALLGCMKISFRGFSFWVISSPSCKPNDGASLLIFQGSSNSIKQPILYHIESDSLEELPNFSFGSRTGNYYSCSATLNGNGLFWKYFNTDIKINNNISSNPIFIYFMNNFRTRIFIY